MPDPVSTVAATPAGTPTAPPATGTMTADAPPAPAPVFTMPNPRPRDDAKFLTGEGQPVAGRCVAVEVSQAGNGADVFRFAFIVAPGEKDKDGRDVGGEVIITDKYLSENAFEYALDTCKILGSATAEELQAAIKLGDAAQKAALVDKLLQELSGPFAASGVGKNAVRISTKSDVFKPQKGPSVTTTRVGFINPIAQKADDVKLKTLGKTLLANIALGKSGGNAGAPAGGTGQNAGSTSPPPAVTGTPTGGTDDVPF